MRRIASAILTNLHYICFGIIILLTVLLFFLNLEAIEIATQIITVVIVLLTLLMNFSMFVGRKLEKEERKAEGENRERRYQEFLNHLEEKRVVSQKESDERFEKILAQMREDSRQAQERFDALMKCMNERDEAILKLLRRGRRYR